MKTDKTNEVLPFPRGLHRNWVRVRAERLMRLKPETAEKCLWRDVLDPERRIMERRGVAPDLIDREIAFLEQVLRVELFELRNTG